MPIFKFDVQDKIVLKKNHPCGSNIFTVARGGTDVKIICDCCSRSLTIEREKLEKTIKKVLPSVSKKILEV